MLGPRGGGLAAGPGLDPTAPRPLFRAGENSAETVRKGAGGESGMEAVVIVALINAAALVLAACINAWAAVRQGSGTKKKGRSRHNRKRS